MVKIAASHAKTLGTAGTRKKKNSIAESTAAI